MPPLPPITKALMLICTAVFCIDKLMAMTGLVVLTPAGLMSPLEGWFALWPLTTSLFLPWQLLSYGFLHGSMMHLFFNMLGLWMFGSELERLWGQRRYITMLLAGLLAAAAVQLIFTQLRGSLAPTVGASGALFGLLLAYGMLFPNRVIMPLFPPIPMKARTFVIVFGALELLLGLSSGDGVAHFAHLGGMLGAFLLLRYWRGQAPFGRRRR
jgi:membrane associated rhomboid family serine protease